MKKRLPVISEKKLTKLIDEKVRQIAEVLISLDVRKLDNGLLSGIAGISVFLFFYSKFKNEKKYKNRGEELLSEIFERINNGFVLHTFCSGIAGITYAIEHLADQGFVDMEDTTILGGFDSFLYQNGINDFKHGNYDYLHGGTGVSLYFLLSQGTDAEGKIENLITELEKQAIFEDNGTVLWTSITDRTKGTHGVNISLSHGISAIIVLLSAAINRNICVEKSEKLLRACVQYMLNNKQDTGKFISYFPNVIEPGSMGQNSRMAWCYGDPGISYALLIAGKCLKEEKWINTSVEILLSSAKRISPEETQVVDACICHGSSGLALIFLQAWRCTGNEEFREASIYWVKQTLDMAIHKNSLAGYSVWHGEEGWKPEAGILEGIAGIGLMLMEVLSEEEGAWLEMILLK